jgi:hypothetical protein
MMRSPLGIKGSFVEVSLVDVSEFRLRLALARDRLRSESIWYADVSDPLVTDYSCD